MKLLAEEENDEVVRLSGKKTRTSDMKIACVVGEFGCQKKKMRGNSGGRKSVCTMSWRPVKLYAIKKYAWHPEKRRYKVKF